MSEKDEYAEDFTDDGGGGGEYADDFTQDSGGLKKASEASAGASAQELADMHGQLAQSEAARSDAAAASAEAQAAMREEMERMAAELDTMKRNEERRKEQAKKSTTAQLEEQVYDLSAKLVAASETSANMSVKASDNRQALDTLKADVRAVRKTLLDGIVGEGADGTNYEHVSLSELVRIRLQAQEIAGGLRAATAANAAAGGEGGDAAPRQAPSKPAPPIVVASAAGGGGEAGEVAMVAIKRLEDEVAGSKRANRRLEERCTALEGDLHAALGASDDVRALKLKAVQLLERGKQEKEARLRAEQGTKLATKKVLALSDHIEKLMLHLRHEAASKAKAHDAAGRAQQETALLRARNQALLRKTNAREQVVAELREGAKILEDQLRLMDSKYIELRAKLDYTRQHTQREVGKAKQQVSSLRAKWAFATGSQAGLLDEVQLDITGPAGGPETNTPLGASGGSAGGKKPGSKGGKKKGMGKSSSAGPGHAAMALNGGPDMGPAGGPTGMRSAASMPSLGTPKGIQMVNAAGSDEPWADANKLQQLMNPR